MHLTLILSFKRDLTMVVSASKVMTTSKGDVAEEGIAIFV